MPVHVQGDYAFFLYDCERKQALAARDPGGKQELFYCMDPDDGSVAFTNSLDQLPPGERTSRWRELPPGHFISGRTPTLNQFALTPEQLESLRERNESGDVGHLLDEDEDDDDEEEDLPARTSGSPPSKPGLFARLSRKIPGL